VIWFSRNLSVFAALRRNPALDVRSHPRSLFPGSLFVLPVLFLHVVLITASLAAGSPGGAVKIGVLAPLTGPYAAGGTSFVQAATLAAERANAEGGVLGSRVAVVVADTQGRVDVAKSEALRLLSRERVDAIVGAYLSEETVGVMEVAAAHRTVMIVPVAATAEITDRVRAEPGRYRYVFRVGYSIPQWAELVTAFLADRSVRRYAFVGAGIRWNRELGDALGRTAAGAGMTPVYVTYYSPGNPAFDPVAVAASGSAPDILVLGDPGKNSVSFLSRLREVAPDLPVLSVGGALGDARLAESLPLSGPLYVQAAAWGGTSASATEYFERYERRYGSPPVGYSDTLPYDAVNVLAAAWRKAGSLSADPVVAVLEKGAFPGVAGTYRFNADHQAQWGTGPGELRGTVIRWERSGARVVFPPR
jgi:branched-chain amino acid transport system substrate-binding protein